MNYLGDFAEDETIYFMFNTFSSDDPAASITISNLINTDIHIHKDNGLTQRNNAAGVTISINFDGITGSHMITIDTNDNTVAGFWTAGNDYFVRIEGSTVDAGTINAVVGHFSIENRFMVGTNSANTVIPDVAGTAATPAEVTAAVADIPTNAEFEARTIAAADYVVTTDTIAGVTLCTTCTTNTDMVGTDGANTTTPPTVTAIRQEMDSNSTRLAAIETDTAGISDAAACVDSASPTANSIADIVRKMKWFVGNLWEIDENVTPNTFKIFKDDNTTTGLDFTVYTDASKNYRDNTP